VSKIRVNVKLKGKKIPVDLTPNGEFWDVQSPYYAPLIEELKAMESASWLPDTKVWRILASKRNAFAFDILSKRLKFSRYLKEYHIENFGGFWEHQNDICSFIKARKRCIIAGEMRTGKTRPTLEYLENNYSGAVIVSTKSAIRGMPREFKKWNFKKDYTLLTYNKFATLWSSGQLPVPEAIVFDEAQKLKTPSSARSIAALECVNAMEETYSGNESVILLSGTPAPKDPSDWWHLCEVARPGFLRESSKQKLAYRLGNFEKMENLGGAEFWALTPTEEYPTGWKQDEVDKLYRIMHGLVKVYLKKDCMELPDIMYEERILKPNQETLDIADSLYYTAPNVLTGTQWVRQLSDGFMYEYEYTEDGKKKRVNTNFVGSPKEDELRNDLDLHEDVGRLIIYAGFQGSLDRVKTLCLEKGWVVLKVDGRGWEAFYPNDHVEEYSTDFLMNEMDGSTNTGSVKKLAFIAQSSSGSTGLELSASPTIIYYSNSDDGEGRMQSEARAHSMNMDKTRGLTVIDYLHLPTDELILRRLQNKADLQAISMGQLKEITNKWREKGDIER